MSPKIAEFTFRKHVHQFGPMIYSIVDNIAAQLDNGYRFRINFHRTKYTSKRNDENQQNDHDDGRGRINRISECDANVFLGFAIQFDDAGHAQWQQCRMSWNNPFLGDFAEFSKLCGRIVFDAEYFDCFIHNVNEHGNQWETQHKQLLIQNGNQTGEK